MSPLSEEMAFFKRNSHGQDRLNRAREIINQRPNIVHERAASGETPLLWAILTGEKEIVRLLLEHGAEVNLEYGMGASALDIAVNRNGYPDVVSMLLEYGADPEHRDHRGQTALMIACMGYVLDAPGREDVLADKEANFHRILNLTHDVNRRDNDGNTALHYVRHPSFLAELCARGSEINVYNKEGKTPLHNYMQEKAELLYAFLRFRPDVNARDVHGQTPLHCVAFNRYDLERPQKAQLLLASGATPNLQDNRGQTPVHVATTTLFWEVLRRLIEAGGDVNIRDNEGRTPLRIIEDGLLKQEGDPENVYSEESYWDVWWPSSNDVAELLHKAGGYL